MTYRCQNGRTGRLGRTLTLTGQVASIGAGFPGDRTEIVDMLDLSRPIGLCAAGSTSRRRCEKICVGR